MNELKYTENNSTLVRIASLADAQIIATFTRTLAWESEGLRLESRVVLNGVKNALKNRQYGFYVVAIRQNKIVGCMMVTYEWSDWRDGVQWWLQSVFVRQENRRIGIFNSMYQFVLEKASHEDNVCGLRLYVDKNNEVAKRTYSALGMEPANYLIYETSLRGS